MIRSERIYQISLYVTLGLLLVTAVYYSIDRIHLTYSYSPDLRGQEKNVVYGIQHAMNDLPSLYRRIDSPPFAFIQYTPIYYYVCAALAKAFQLTPGKNLHDIYVLCRQLNIFLNLCSSFLVFYILFVILKSRWEIALLAGILLLLSSQSHSWAIRPDPLKNVFFLLSLLFYLIWIQNHKIIPAILSSLSVALAIFTKQDMVVLAMAYLFFAFFYADRKEFLQYLGVLSGLGIAGLGIFTLIHGVSIWENLYWAVNNGASLANAKSIVSGYIGSYIYLIPLGIFVSLLSLMKAVSLPEKLLGILVLFLLGFGSLSCSKAGSLIAYFNETNTAMIISIGFYISQEIAQKAHIYLLTSILALAMGYQMASGYKPEMVRLNDSNLSRQEKKTFETASTVRDFLDPKLRKSDFIYTNDPVLKNMFFQNCVLPMDDIVFFNMKAGTFDPKPYVQFLKEKHVRYAIFRKDELTQDILGQNFANFLPIKTVGNYIIYQQP